jgi:glycosyltransferase involved in cell wall biosynthesis
MSIIEGWSVKTPGVCFDYPVLRELYQDCVVYAKPNSILDLREKIDMLYKDEAMQKEMAEKGYERYLQYFTPKNMAANMLEQMNV